MAAFFLWAKAIKSLKDEMKAAQELTTAPCLTQ